MRALSFALLLAAACDAGRADAQPTPQAVAPVPAQPPPPAAKAGKLVYRDTAMGTNVSVWFWTNREVDAARTAKAMFDEIKRLDRESTTWRPDSEIADQHRVGRAPGQGLRRDAPGDRARRVDVSRRSSGVFDITVQLVPRPVELRRGHGRLAAGPRRGPEASRARRLERHRHRSREEARSSCAGKAWRSRSAASRRAMPSTNASRSSRRPASPTSWCRPAETCTWRQ